MTLYFYTLNLHYSLVKLKIILSHTQTNYENHHGNIKKSSPLSNHDKPSQITNIRLFEQVVYIPPKSLKMKIKKTKFASFWGRSV